MSDLFQDEQLRELQCQRDALHRERIALQLALDALTSQLTTNPDEALCRAHSQNLERLVHCGFRERKLLDALAQATADFR